MLHLIPLGATLSYYDYLEVGKTYTFVFRLKRLIEYRSDAWITQQLKDCMRLFGDVVSADTKTLPALYGDMRVVVVPRARYTVRNWVENGFKVCLDRMGYGHVFDRVETGEVRGGVIEEVAQKTETAIASIIKPLMIPIIAIGAIALVLALKKSRSEV
jgi:hypothetical protein